MQSLSFTHFYTLLHGSVTTILLVAGCGLFGVSVAYAHANDHMPQPNRLSFEHKETISEDTLNNPNNKETKDDKDIIANATLMPDLADSLQSTSSQTLSTQLELPQFQDTALSVLPDPISKLPIKHSYAVTVPRYLSLPEAQQLLSRVSPKLVAHQAAVLASEYQSQAVATLNRPIFFAGASATAYDVQEDISLEDLKSGIVNDVGDLAKQLELPPEAWLPVQNATTQIVNIIPNDYPLELDGTSLSANVGMVWPVYTAGRTTAIQNLADAKVLESEADEQMDTHALYTTLVQRYYEAQLAVIASDLRNNALQTFAQTDHMAQRLYEEGFISYVDRLSAKTALADAQSEAINANSTAKLAMRALQVLLRSPKPVKPTSPLFVSSRPLPEVTFFQELALQHHPGLKKVAAKQQQVKQLHKISDVGLKPNVSVFGYGTLDKDPSWMAGVSATWKLSGGLNSTALKHANTAKQRQAELTQIEVADNILLLVEKNWYAVNNAQARYFATQAHIESAFEVLRLRQLGLQEGVNTTLDVVQAQTQYFKARAQQAQAANDYVQALAALMSSVGNPLAFNAYMNVADNVLPTLYMPDEQELRQIQGTGHKDEG